METPLLKIDSIRRCVSRVRQIAAQNPGLETQDAQDLIVLNLQRACEQSLDLGNWVCAFRNLSVPRTSREVFTLLESAGVLPPVLASNMRKMVGFRNIAVHEYQELDPAIIKNIVLHRLGDFERYVEQISLNLEIKSELSPSLLANSRPKVLCLSLSPIELTGDDLGDDFQIEFVCQKATTKVILQKTEGRLAAKHQDFAALHLDPDVSNLPLQIFVKEIDPIVDDFGQSELNINISALSEDQTFFDISVAVLGKGRTEQNKAASLKFKLAVTLSSGIVQLKDTDPNGWLLAKLATGNTIPLPANLAVEITGRYGGREYFNVLEGGFKGTSASIALDQDGITHLTRLIRRKPAIQLKLFREQWKLQIPSLGEFEVLEMKPAEIIHTGIYQLCLPDAPHRGGGGYRKGARHAETWFRINDDSDRYLHPGARTKGCITIKDIESWEKIYHHLIVCRIDDIHIGTLEVL